MRCNVRLSRLLISIGALVALDPIDRNQRQAQGVEPAQQTLQSGLVDGAGQGSDRRTITLAFDRNGHPPVPLRPTFIEVSRHLDLVGLRSIQG